MKSGVLLASTITIGILIVSDPARAAWDFTTIAAPVAAAGDMVASGIGDAGQAAGSHKGDVPRGFTVSGSPGSPAEYAAVDIGAAASATATGVNNSGPAVGYYSPGDYYSPGGYYSPVGYYSNAPNDARATGGLIDPSAGAAGAMVRPGIDPAGPGLGAYGGGGTRGVTGAPGVAGTADSKIDSNGDVVGYYTDGGGFAHEFVDLNGAFYTVDDPDGVTTEVLGINDQLMVVGISIDASGVITGFTDDVPEPATFVLFSLSVLGAAGLRRRRPPIR